MTRATVHRCASLHGKLAPGSAIRLIGANSLHAHPETFMIPFFVLIKCDLGKSYEVANELADAEIASEIYSTAGDYDLLVKFYVENGTDIAPVREPEGPTPSATSRTPRRS